MCKPHRAKAASWGFLCITVLCTLLAFANAARAEVSVWVGPYPTLRARVGPAFHATQSVRVQGTADFALDLSAGLPIVILPPGSGDLLGRVVVLYPEVGYAYQTSGQHLFAAGTYVGYGSGFFYGSYGMRFLAGQQQEARALGLRHGLGVHFVFDLFSLGLEHQALWVGPSAQHDIILWFGLNLVQIANIAGKIH